MTMAKAEGPADAVPADYMDRLLTLLAERDAHLLKIAD